MEAGRLRLARGFTLVELMIVVSIIGVLAAVAIQNYREYSRRASLSEVVLATAGCKQVISENYTFLSDAPDPGKWGCESSGTTRKYAGAVQTSDNGVIRIAIRNLDGLVNGQYVYMVPAKTDGSPMVTPDDLGRNVPSWICGSDWLPVRKAMPANCRTDTTTYSTQTFQ
ncbi:pilin [Caenimonas aquaedulcis]|uniref:pilin n=1 Tax=Caenimonas aquaedulcis TaxID=2793270 RepID=UPI00338EDCD8